MDKGRTPHRPRGETRSTQRGCDEACIYAEAEYRYAKKKLDAERKGGPAWHMILPLSRTSSQRGSTSFPKTAASRKSSQTPLRPSRSSTSLSRAEVSRQSSLDKKRGRPINLGAAHRTGVIKEETVKEGKQKERAVSLHSTGGDSAGSLSPTGTEEKKARWRQVIGTEKLRKWRDKLKIAEKK